MFIKDLWIVLEDDQEVRIITTVFRCILYSGPAINISGGIFDKLVRRIIVNDDKSLNIMV